VRDVETGEPLQVYHGGTFIEEDIPNAVMHFGTREAANDRIKRKRKNKESYRINGYFLNIRNPNYQPDWGLAWDKVIEHAKKKGADGIIYKNKYEDAGSESFLTFYPAQIKSADNNAGTYGSGNPSILFQTGARAVMEEAAEFDTWEEWRDFVVGMDADLGEYAGEAQQAQTQGEAAYDAWFKSFHENAVKAVNSTDTDGAGVKQGTPAVMDREFINLMEDVQAFDDFAEAAAAVYNDDLSGGALTEEDAAAREDAYALREEMGRVFAHTGWQALFKAGGRIASGTQRKQLVSLMRKNPRDYRAAYAQIMDAPDYAVAAEDMQAARLKYELGDRLKSDTEGLSPEKLRELAEMNEVDEFARLWRTGRVKFNNPGEKRYLKEQNAQIAALEKTIEAGQAQRKEEDQILGHIVGREFLETFDRAVKTKENIRRQSEKLDRALKRGEGDAARAARLLKGMNTSFNNLVAGLNALAREHNLELDIHAALADEKTQAALNAQREVLKSEAARAASAADALNKAEATAKKGEADAKIKALKADYKAALKTGKLEARLAKRAGSQQMREHLTDLKNRREQAKEETRTKAGQIRRIFRRVNQQDVNHEQGQAIVYIQRMFEPSIVNAADRFINGVERPYLHETYSMFKTDADFREKTLAGKGQATQRKLERILSKERFEDITNDERRYLLTTLSKSLVESLNLKDVIAARDKAFNKATAEQAEAVVREYLPDEVFYRIQEKPLDEWTLAEAEELAQIIDGIQKTGKEIRKANVDADNRRIDAMKKAAAAAVKEAIPNRYIDKPGDDEATRERKRQKREALFIKYGAGGTAQEGSRRRKVRGGIFRFNDMDDRRFVQYYLDNGEKGSNSAVLIRRADEAYDKKMRMADKRLEAVTALMDKENIKVEDLYKPAAAIDMGGDIGQQSFTVSELIGTALALKNDYSRNAVNTGNLLSKLERQEWQDGLIDDGAAQELADNRLAVLEAETAAFFAAPENRKYAGLMAAMGADLRDNGGRLNEALIKYNNTEMPLQENYYMMSRTEPVSSHVQNAQVLKEMTGSAGGNFQMYVERGFTKQRTEIPAKYQTPIDLDAFKMWANAVEKQEHFIAYGGLVKDLNRIYKDPNSTARTWIDRRFGADGVKRVNRIIDGYINPEGSKTKAALDETLSGMRRNYAAAVLGGRVVPIVKQFITSPGAFLAHLEPAEYWGSFIGFSMNYNARWNEIQELSPFMKHRSANMIVEEANQAAKFSYDQKGGAVARWNQKSMGGLEMIDRLCVASGWWALYNKEFTRLTRENPNADEGALRRQAVTHADDIVKMTQPSGRPEDIAPMFKGNSETSKAFLQFQQSLNVIWQQTRYDLPMKIRNKEYKQAAGQVMGYVMAGLMLGIFTVGFDDDDDEETKNKKMASWALSQFTDSIPIAGSIVSDVTEMALTGKTPYRHSTELIPVVSGAYGAGTNLIKALYELDEGNDKKARERALKSLWEAAKTGGFVTGLPVMGVQDIGRGLGIGDGDGGINPDPSKIIGVKNPLDLFD
jgi:hypothetical protein